MCAVCDQVGNVGPCRTVCLIRSCLAGLVLTGGGAAVGAESGYFTTHNSLFLDGVGQRVRCSVKCNLQKCLFHGYVASAGHWQKYYNIFGRILK